MTGWAFLLIFTTTIAVLALVVAVISLRKSRSFSLAADALEIDKIVVRTDEIDSTPAGTPKNLEPSIDLNPLPVRTNEDVQVIGGRVLVKPTNEQIVLATLGRPLVRISVLVEGIQYALRPQSRDRLRRVISSEYRTRKSLRRKAARAAAWRNDRANSSAPASFRSTQVEP